MNIDNYTDAIKNCRFCFMCRHLSAIGNVLFTEADTPRVRAAMIYGITSTRNTCQQGLIDTLYRSDLSAAAAITVSATSMKTAQLAARTDVVRRVCPECQNIAAELKKSEKWTVKGPVMSSISRLLHGGNQKWQSLR